MAFSGTSLPQKTYVPWHLVQDNVESWSKLTPSLVLLATGFS